MGLKEKIKSFGPGIVTGGADNDPAGVITYTMAGSLFGYSILWVLLLATPMMIAVQEVAARIAIVTKKGLAKIIKERYGRVASGSIVASLAIANLLTLGADTAAVSAVLSILTGVNWFIIAILLTALIWYLVLFGKYREIKVFLVAFTFLLVVYVISAFYFNINVIHVLKGFIPNFKPSFMYLSVVVGIMGTTISPYMLFWQSSDEIEERKKVIQIRAMDADTAIGMSWSNLIAIFIIITSAVTLHANHIPLNNILVASLPLKPFGELAFLLFSIGIIFSGLVSIPVLAGSTAYAVSDAFGWREGLNKKVYSAKGFYFVLSVSLFVGVSLLALPFNPISFLFYTQVIDGFLIPVIIFFLFFISNDKNIMKKHTTGKLQNIVLILFLAFTVLFDILLLKSL